MAEHPHQSGRADDPRPAPPRRDARTRDHLANERTFLAWVRTALSLIGLGFVVARMGLFLHETIPHTQRQAQSYPVGKEFLITGAVILIMGTALAGWGGWLYRRTRIGIEAEQFEPAHGTVFVLTLVVVVGGLILVGLLAMRGMSVFW